MQIFLKNKAGENTTDGSTNVSQNTSQCPQSGSKRKRLHLSETQELVKQEMKLTVRKCYVGHFFITTSKGLRVPGKVGGQVVVAHGLSSCSGVSGLAPGEEPPKSMLKEQCKSLQTTFRGVNSWSRLPTMTFIRVYFMQTSQIPLYAGPYRVLYFERNNLNSSVIT